MWIACEGIDGSGKTTVSIRVAQRLRERGLKVFHVRESGRFRSRLATRIRDLTRDAEQVSLIPETELLLNAAREAQIIAEEIRYSPSFMEKVVVPGMSAPPTKWVRCSP